MRQSSQRGEASLVSSMKWLGVPQVSLARAWRWLRWEVLGLGEVEGDGAGAAWVREMAERMVVRKIVVFMLSMGFWKWLEVTAVFKSRCSVVGE